MSIANKPVAVVTGASRGAGKGIALALAELGATVYVTGRSQHEGAAPLPGTVYATAEAVSDRGGKGIGVICDHADDDQVKALFNRVSAEQGRVDILVNNACCLPDGLVQPGPFWEKPLALQDLLNVGMRSSYVSSFYAAPLLLNAGAGLIVNTSSAGGRCYMHGPAYGAGKAAVDKMAHDMAVDFHPHNVAVISLWMGLLKTERSLRVFESQPELYADAAAMAESPEFPGRVIAALARDGQRMARTGKVFYGAELALEYGVTDVGGEERASPRSVLGAPTQFSGAVIA